MSDVTVHFDGKTYDFEDFTLDELEFLETSVATSDPETGERHAPAWHEIDYLSARAMRALATVIRQREDPEFDPSSLGSLSLKAFRQPDEKPTTRRPTKAAT